MRTSTRLSLDNAEVHQDVLAHFNVKAPTHVAKTAIANVWKVTRPDGSPAALKVYHGDDMLNESHGFDLAESLNGIATAKVFQRTSNAALIEWLDGQSLGDTTRAGNDDKATSILLAVAKKINANSPPHKQDTPDLHSWYKALFELSFDEDCPPDTIKDFERAKAIARHLLNTQTNIAWLHGDLHHDNVLGSARGYLAFDAKGVVGEAAYELANACRNPVGADALMRDPVRIHHITKTWGTGLGTSPKRMLQWATAKTALSIAWSANGQLKTHKDLDLLNIFVSLAEPA